MPDRGTQSEVTWWTLGQVVEPKELGVMVVDWEGRVKTV